MAVSKVILRYHDKLMLQRNDKHFDTTVMDQLETGANDLNGKLRFRKNLTHSSRTVLSGC